MNEQLVPRVTPVHVFNDKFSVDRPGDAGKRTRRKDNASLDWPAHVERRMTRNNQFNCRLNACDCSSKPPIAVVSIALFHSHRMPVVPPRHQPVLPEGAREIGQGPVTSLRTSASKWSSGSES
jgi:hypothetical protein